MPRHTSVFRFVVERIIPAATGGYTYYRALPIRIFWTHTLIYMFIYLVPVIIRLLSHSSLATTLSCVHIVLTSLIWLLVKLFNYLIHKQFDHYSVLEETEQSNLSPAQIHEDEPPPYGISPAIWNIRNRITDFSDVDINTMVSQYIQQGYNPNELFLFFEHYTSGHLHIQPEDTLIETPQQVIPTTLKLCCCVFTVINWTRKELEQWFDRPLHIIELIIAPLLTAALGVLGYFNASTLSQVEQAFFFISIASAQFSLLKAPNPDSVSTTVQDPLIPYLRSFHLITFQLLYLSTNALIANLDEDKTFLFFDMHISLSQIFKAIRYVLQVILLAFPIFCALGLFGSVKTAIFYTFDLFSYVIIGKSSSITFFSSVLSAFFNLLIVVAFSVFYYFFKSPILKNLLNGLCTCYGFFISSYSFTPFVSRALCVEKIKITIPHRFVIWKRVIVIIVHSFTIGIIVFACSFIKAFKSELALYISSGVVIVIALPLHMILPIITSRYPFNTWSMPFFNIHNLVHLSIAVRIIEILERNIFIPICLTTIISLNGEVILGLDRWLESFIFVMSITGMTCLAYRYNVRFALVLCLTILGGNPTETIIFRTFLYMQVFWKLSELMNKMQFVFKYSSFHSLTNKFQVVFYAIVIANLQFTCLTSIVAALMAAPIMPICGLTLFLPSYGRPATFWEETNSYDPKPGDSLFYKVISDSLCDKLATFMKEGTLFQATDNDFFLICDDYFNAIVHIISTGVGYVVFQLRGLEVREQTLCHINELNVVRNGVENMETLRNFVIAKIFTRITGVFWRLMNKLFVFMNIPQVLGDNERAFLRSCTWKTLQDDLPLDSYSVSAIRLDMIFPDKTHQIMVIEALFKVLTMIITEEDDIFVPEDFEISLPEEIAEVCTEWIRYQEKTSVARTVAAITQILMDQMEGINGGFEWQIYSMFISKNLNLSQFSWLPASYDQKLIDAFRISISIAVHMVSNDLPDDINELSQYFNDRIVNQHFIPENDPNWKLLIEDRIPELETLRKCSEPNGVTIKYMLFTYCEQKFKLVQLNGESVRGFWAEQTAETMFMETDDRERGSVQFDQFTLRNIISQSANSPVGYPEVICPITYSFCHLY